MIKKSKIYILNDLKFMKSNLSLILIFTFIQYIHGEEILCELRGTYETTYSIPSRNYLQDIGDALKNFTAGPYTPFLVDKAKANISDKWDKEEFFVNQYWNKDDISGELTLVDYEVDPDWARNNLRNVVIQGGLDPKKLLTPESEMLEGATKYIRAFKDIPYIFNLGHGLLPETDPDKVKRLVEFYRNFDE